MTDDERLIEPRNGDDELIEAMLAEFHKWPGAYDLGMARVLAVVRAHDATVVAAQRAELDRIFDGRP